MSLKSDLILLCIKYLLRKQNFLRLMSEIEGMKWGDIPDIPLEALYGEPTVKFSRIESGVLKNHPSLFWIVALAKASQSVDEFHQKMDEVVLRANTRLPPYHLLY